MRTLTLFCILMMGCPTTHAQQEVIVDRTTELMTVSRNECNEDKPIIIDSVELENIHPIIRSLRKCIEEDEHATAFVSGSGGAPEDAMTFFDFIRTEGLSKDLTFIASGNIASASNIVWLAAETRIVLPSSMFLLHEATWYLCNEDLQVRAQSTKHLINSTTLAVRLATGNPLSADRWNDIIQSNQAGVMLNAEEALEWGWATEIREYKDTPEN